jgi:hypothetical protein
MVLRQTGVVGIEKMDFKNKNIIHESKWRSLTFASICFVFVSFAIFSDLKNTDSIIFWNSTVLFGGGLAYFTVRLLNPKNVFVSPNSDLEKKIRKDSFDKVYEDNGIFKYTENGFRINSEGGELNYNWADILSMIGYKQDHFTTDSICLEFKTNDGLRHKINEETNGWFQFVKISKENINQIPKDWELTIMLPVFEPTPTLLFDYKNRNLLEVAKDWENSPT